MMLVPAQLVSFASNTTQRASRAHESQKIFKPVYDTVLPMEVTEDLSTVYDFFLGRTKIGGIGLEPRRCVSERTWFDTSSSAVVRVVVEGVRHRRRCCCRRRRFYRAGCARQASGRAERSRGDGGRALSPASLHAGLPHGHRRPGRGERHRRAIFCES